MGEGVPQLSISVNFLFLRGLMVGTSRTIGELAQVLEEANQIFAPARVSIVRGPIVESVEFGPQTERSLWDRATITSNPDGSTSHDMRRLIQLLRGERRRLQRRNELLRSAGGARADVNVFFVREAEVPENRPGPRNLAGDTGGWFQILAGEQLIVIDDNGRGYSGGLVLAHEVVHWAQNVAGVADSHNTITGNLMGTNTYPVIRRPDGTTIQRIGRSTAGPALTERQIRILRHAAQ